MTTATAYRTGAAFFTATMPNIRRLWVYVKGEFYADYTADLAFDVAAELRGDVVDPETGEILN